MYELTDIVSVKSIEMKPTFKIDYFLKMHIFEKISIENFFKSKSLQFFKF